MKLITILKNELLPIENDKFASEVIIKNDLFPILTCIGHLTIVQACTVLFKFSILKFPPTGNRNPVILI